MTKVIQIILGLAVFIGVISISFVWYKNLDYRSMERSVNRLANVKAYWFDYYEGRSLDLHIWRGGETEYVHFWSAESEDFERPYTAQFLQIAERKIFCSWVNIDGSVKSKFEGITMKSLDTLVPNDQPLSIPILVREYERYLSFITSLPSQQSDSLPFQKGSYPENIFNSVHAGTQSDLRCWTEFSPIPETFEDAKYL